MGSTTSLPPVTDTVLMRCSLANALMRALSSRFFAACGMSGRLASKSARTSSTACSVAAEAILRYHSTRSSASGT